MTGRPRRPRASRQLTSCEHGRLKSVLPELAPAEWYRGQPFGLCAFCGNAGESASAEDPRCGECAGTVPASRVETVVTLEEAATVNIRFACRVSAIKYEPAQARRVAASLQAFADDQESPTLPPDPGGAAAGREREILDRLERLERTVTERLGVGPPGRSADRVAPPLGGST
jgi:hypothetical protein